MGFGKVVRKLLSLRPIFVHVEHGHAIGDRFELFPGGGALIVPDRVLVFADLHLGCEAALEADGLSLPRVQTRKIQEYVSHLVDEVRPSKVVIAGDLKHNFSRNLNQEWDDVARFVRCLRERVPLAVVRGNHDNFLGSILREHSVPFLREADVSGVRVVHGHEGWLDGRPTVMGHIHPSVTIRDRSGAGVKDSCFLYSESHSLLVLPQLSIVASGADVLADRDFGHLSPPLSGLDTSSFVPVVFSRGVALRFPSIGKMRNGEMV